MKKQIEEQEENVDETYWRGNGVLKLQKLPRVYHKEKKDERGERYLELERTQIQHVS